MSTALELAAIYCIAALGVLLTSVVVEFFDLTVDGSFTLGAAIACLLLRDNGSPILALMGAAVAGGIAGLLTAGVWRLGIQPLLSGILVMFSLYSINLHVMGASNVSLANVRRLLPAAPTLLLCLGALLAALTVWWLLLTPVGAQMRAVPRSASFLQGVGISPSVPVITALLFSNALVSAAGATMAQLQGYADISMGDGTLVFSLAAIILGRAIVRNRRRPAALIVAVVLGGITYQLVIYVALRAGVPPVELRLLTAALVILVLVGSRAGDGLVRNRAATRH